ncbi:hypothetical protein [Devosia sp. SD17-2]|jgi:hypothetical protein|uniref:hypothetical protein n=1 Tax=Devosia sp. SD17-2 TaxID=2976459 RepID=UPI0023D821DF|nr:hypothetical protein [Devosia sp. SD17-2]WEJ32740.1 hypothetical protein NYQ88_17945 [Devosia sp. SD17-2]
MNMITLSPAEAEKIVKAIVMASDVLNKAVIGDEFEDADVTVGGKKTSARAIDDGLLAAVRIIRSKQGR